MYSVTLTTGKDADFLLLVTATEIERVHVRASVDFPLAKLKHVVAFRNFLIDRRVIVERISRLIDVSQLNRVSDLQFARIRFILPGDHAEKSCFTSTVGTNDADDSARRQSKRKIVHQNFVIKAFANILGFDDDVAQMRARRNLNFQFLDAFTLLFGQHFFVGSDTGFAFRLPSLGCHADPFEFFRERLFSIFAHLLFDLQASFFLLEP